MDTEGLILILVAAGLGYLVYRQMSHGGGDAPSWTVPGTGGEDVGTFISLIPRDIAAGVGLGLLVLAI